MKRTLCSGWLLLAVLTLPAYAQPESGVRELKDAEITEEELLKALSPEGEPPEELRARGVVIAPQHPRCTLYRQQTTRGIALKPAKAVALSIPFAFNSAELMPDATRRLNEVGRALSTGKLASSCFHIEGHTDAVGSDSYNDRLSRRRAEAVVNYLSERFAIDRERLLPVGRGERNPLASNETESGRSRNRRVQVVNLGYGEAEP